VRKIDVIALTLVVVVASAGVTYYVSRHPLRRSTEERIQIGAEKPIQKLSPGDILKPPQPTATPATGASGSEEQATSAALALHTSIIVHPEWKPGATHVMGAYAITKQQGFIAPTWSPLGLDVAFTTYERAGIWVAGPNGTDARQVSDDRLPQLDFAWSADGMQLTMSAVDRRPIALMLTGEKYPIPEIPRRVTEREGNIYVADDEGGLQRITGSQDRFSGPKLSPDETLVAYAGIETGLYISTVDGKRTISVGKGENPSWLPDSSGIVYDIPISDGAHTIDGDLWFAAADGSERTNITNTPGIVEAWPAVSPDGLRIAFVAEGAVYVGKLVRPKKP
jgi:hypothetical protein